MRRSRCAPAKTMTWIGASAVVTSYTGHHDPDTALDILHKRHGRWRLTKHSPGTAGVSCGIGMPRSDQRNLGVICTHGT